MTPLEFHEEYNRLAHAVQTGVMYVLERDPSGASPKHLRTGVNTAKVELGALCKLLIDKGLVTQDEVFGYILDGLRDEIAMYERQLKQQFGAEITLG